MKIGSAYQSALVGLKNGMRGLDRNAAEVARAAGNPEQGPPVQALVESRVNQRQVEANVQVMKAADEMLGALLDEKA